MPFDVQDLDDALEHETFRARLGGVRVLDDGSLLELDLQLLRPWIEWSLEDAANVWIVGLRFRGVRSWNLRSRHIDSVGVVPGHPALRAFEASTSRLSYRGEPADPTAATAALHLAHYRAVGSELPIDLEPGSAFPSGWTTGTVADGPTSLMEAYAEALRTHGLEPVLTETTTVNREEPANAVSAFVVGDGHVVAEVLETFGELPPSDFT